MDAVINIITINSTITVTRPIDFSPVELPYGCKGYRFNGSSTATLDNLNKYWNFVDAIFLEAGIATSEYLTLKDLTYDGVFYGVSDEWVPTIVRP